MLNEMQFLVQAIISAVFSTIGFINLITAMNYCKKALDKHVHLVFAGIWYIIGFVFFETNLHILLVLGVVVFICNMIYLLVEKQKKTNCSITEAK